MQGAIDRRARAAEPLCKRLRRRALTIQSDQLSFLLRQATGGSRRGRALRRARFAALAQQAADGGRRTAGLLDKTLDHRSGRKPLRHPKNPSSRQQRVTLLVGHPDRRLRRTRAPRSEKLLQRRAINARRETAVLKEVATDRKPRHAPPLHRRRRHAAFRRDRRYRHHRLVRINGLKWRRKADLPEKKSQVVPQAATVKEDFPFRVRLESRDTVKDVLVAVEAGRINVGDQTRQPPQVGLAQGGGCVEEFRFKRANFGMNKARHPPSSGDRRATGTRLSLCLTLHLIIRHPRLSVNRRRNKPFAPQRNGRQAVGA